MVTGKRATGCRWALATAALALGASGLAIMGPAEAAQPAEAGGANTAPLTTVTGPSGPTSGPVVVRGRATDDRSITTVKLTVKDRQTGRYWNPDTGRWQSEWLWFDTSLRRARSRATDWSFAFAPSSGSGRYRVSAVAWDDQATRDPGIAQGRFWIEADGDSPTTAVTSPAAGAEVPAGALTITGSAADDDGLDRVMVTVRDLAADRYWNPETGDWQSPWLWSRSALASPGATGSTWRYRFDPSGTGGSGRYRVTATAWDTSGLQDGTRGKVQFTTVGAEPPVDPDGLVWHDEFNGNRVDPTHWKTVTGTYGGPYTVQDYTDRARNIRVENGNLVLQAHREDSNGQRYTSGMVVSDDFRRADNGSTRGNTSWRYGRYEMRARVPDASGLWPAFWMRPAEGVHGWWPRSGEIDIMEYAGPTPTSWTDRRIVNDLHWWSDTARDNNGSMGHFTRVSEAWLDQFHTYAIEWSPTGFRWYTDGVLTHSANRGWSAPDAPYPAPFDENFFITINLQVGGWAGNVADPQLPGSYEIDWVRVYQ